MNSPQCEMSVVQNEQHTKRPSYVRIVQGTNSPVTITILA